MKRDKRLLVAAVGLVVFFILLIVGVVWSGICETNKSEMLKAANVLLLAGFGGTVTFFVMFMMSPP